MRKGTNMDNLIDRKVLTQYLIDNFNAGWSFHDLLSAISQVPLKSISHWIPVKERLPEEYETNLSGKMVMSSDLVQVTVADLEKEEVFVADDCTCERKWCNFGSSWQFEVLAWAPMLEPYKP